MDLYSESRSLVLDLWHQDILKRTPPAQPWIEAHVAPMIVEIGRDLLLPLVSAEKEPPIVTAFGRHRRVLWEREQMTLPKMTCKDNLNLPRTLVKANWNEFVFAQFTVVPHSIFVPGEAPKWANDICLRAPGGFWIANGWEHCFSGKFLTIPDFVAQKVCVQFETFRQSYRTPR
ncbi:MAG: hypothetical protein KF760_10075 [Candidatus Eremiobacteraeota bacterium]|nr:hypothetical protein [Candidatus Eremiobacteraeota bacterium]MCW5871270.1 hypothetical protein [Candidatus Eremiobacteraeota bacterium]